MTSSGTHSAWAPRIRPLDARAAAHIDRWLTQPDQPLGLIGADLRGADLSGGKFWAAWLTSADLRGVRMHGADLYRAHLEAARLTGADLTGSDLTRAELDGADLRDAILDRTKFGRASISGVDARGASFHGCEFGDASVLDTDVRGANLNRSTCNRALFGIRFDETTTFDGMHGSIIGPCVLVEGTTERELGGADLGRWLTDHGADVEVIQPRNG